MSLRFDARPLLGALFIMWANATAIAADAERLAEMQKSLNAEVLAQPFSVAKPEARPAATEPTAPARPAPRCVTGCGSSWVYPSLSFGLRFGHHRHHVGWGYGHRFHRHDYYRHGHRRY